MAEAAYAVVFKGEVVEGFEREQVKAAFARLFGLGAERLEALFAHPFVVLKRGLSHADGTRYVEALRRIGAVAKPAQIAVKPRFRCSHSGTRMPTLKNAA